VSELCVVLCVVVLFFPLAVLVFIGLAVYFGFGFVEFFVWSVLLLLHMLFGNNKI